MKIGLIDVDGHNFPNLCIMKISAFHKAHGNDVEWWRPDGKYDAVYISKVFTESKMPKVNNADVLHVGGSGIDLENKLPFDIEHSTPDYSLYPQFNFALGFLTRGCPRLNHGFCITPQKDGCQSVKVADLSEFWKGQKEIVLLDQNMLACNDRMELIHQLSNSGARIEFNGGMDARFMTNDVIDKLRFVKVKDYHFAWDDPRENLLPQFTRIAQSGLVNPNGVGVYVLTNFWSSIDEDLSRVYNLRALGFMPYIMIYDKQKFVDGRGRWLPDVREKFVDEQIQHFKICQHMQRWCGNRKILKSCPDFENYEPYQKMKSGSSHWRP